MSPAQDLGRQLPHPGAGRALFLAMPWPCLLARSSPALPAAPMAQVCHPGQGSHPSQGNLHVPASPGARVHPGGITKKKVKNGKLKNPHHYETNELNAELCLPRALAATPAKYQVTRKELGRAGRGRRFMQALGTWICPGSPTETVGASQPAAVQRETVEGREEATREEKVKRKPSASASWFWGFTQSHF